MSQAWPVSTATITDFPLAGLPMSQMGHSRRFDRAPIRSGLPQQADNQRADRHFAFVPNLPLALQKRSRWSFARNDQETARLSNARAG
jgi:hypothetical protein